ncbi:MAG: hypothetical protein FD143_1243 [Ignavibacteria bacterium]|nr:MAG: hypothetical protein FD143_1243 [Ignavibacteria bacterium]KAF0160753.1 MAG: hypothetical protein FD188_1529 [Ignavibacteria bacterium]
MVKKVYNYTSGFTQEEISFFKSFKKPHDIQLYLNTVAYNPEYITRSPKMILHYKQANCFEGALFAAAALRFLGYKPLIVDMMAVNDDDHVITVFKKNNRWGAVAKSNTTLLRFREPVYKTLRELVMSYFEFYFNTLGDKSLRSFSNPVNLEKFDKHNWMATENDLDFIGDYLFEIKHKEIYPSSSRSINKADKEVMEICFSGAVAQGLFVPKETKS